MCGGGKDDTTKQIDAMLAQDANQMKKEFKLLLLGAGESGKSTIAKQMVLIHRKDNPFTDVQLADYKRTVHQNIVESMATIVDYIRMKAGQPDNTDPAWKTLDANDALKQAGDELVKMRDDNTVVESDNSTEVLQKAKASIAALYGAEAVKKALLESNNFQLPDRAEFFFKELERVTTTDYKPTNEDILSARRRTTGVHEIAFDSEGVTFRVIDVGGQRSERRKWFHCFEDVTAIIFIASLSEYNQVLFEDEKTNRMQEALTLFEEICGSMWFDDPTIILFLNKKDIFEEKIKIHDLKIAFPNYKGGCNYEQALEYIKRKFKKAGTARNPDRLIVTHVTFALDTENVNVVFRAVRETILKNAMGGM